MKLSTIANAAENYHSVLAENRKLYNEVQDLKGTVLGITLTVLSLLVAYVCFITYYRKY